MATGLMAARMRAAGPAARRRPERVRHGGQRPPSRAASDPACSCRCRRWCHGRGVIFWVIGCDRERPCEVVLGPVGPLRVREHDLNGERGQRGSSESMHACFRHPSLPQTRSSRHRVCVAWSSRRFVPPHSFPGSPRLRARAPFACALRVRVVGVAFFVRLFPFDSFRSRSSAHAQARGAGFDRHDERRVGEPEARLQRQGPVGHRARAGDARDRPLRCLHGVRRRAEPRSARGRTRLNGARSAPRARTWKIVAQVVLVRRKLRQQRQQLQAEWVPDGLHVVRPRSRPRSRPRIRTHARMHA